jgi:DNA (cytosine-5)-methyltransferase 1
VTHLAYYNEIDPYAAQWLRNLIAAGHIAPGDVDERSIEDVRPDELVRYTQCHFFAGIGVWSAALRDAGWPDSRPVWTGSCPCQPFSAAGQGEGFADERHLWPAFFHLIEQRDPPAVLGEQVASADADPWIDLVCADLESLGYAVGALAFPSAGVGAPHIRDRLYWAGLSGVAQGDTGSAGLEGRGEGPGAARGRHGEIRPVAAAGKPRWLANAAGTGLQRWRAGEAGDGGLATRIEPERLRDASGLADANGERCGKTWERELQGGRAERLERDSGDSRPGPVNGPWRAADWLHCRDGKWRPVEPGTFPLAHGAARRVGRLRAYGNAINKEAARVFIECVTGGLA